MESSEPESQLGICNVRFEDRRTKTFTILEMPMEWLGVGNVSVTVDTNKTLVTERILKGLS